ncbi:MAG: Rne/Rng family ribonuclease [Deltaproteobacteria bacterium]|nr:Rne/Rng family ribonuclease [Deltaproteobacteria bacterium]
MGVQLIINAEKHETRVALVEDGVVAELLFERAKERGIVGNIYKGRVQRVLPGMQAAFVDVGLDKAAFLYVGDILPKAHHDDDDDEDKPRKEEGGEGGGAGAGATAAEAEAEREGQQTRPERRREDLRIEELVKEGQEILVQVTKDAIGTKGVRVTCQVTLPGRHLVYMPTSNHVGISRRIVDESERARLREIVDTLRPAGTGFVVRTASEGVPRAKLQADIEFLVALWRDVQKKNEAMRAPALIHPDLDLMLRATRDIFTTDVEKLVVDDRAAHDRIVEFINGFQPSLARAVELYQGTEPLFDHLGIEQEVSRALSRKVWLKSGGYIVIDQAEALCAIDVNTGRYVGKRNLEDTITKTNMEAVREIAYQLRLRNMGGMIVIDFIDMDRQQNRDKVQTALLEELKKDRARTNVVRISELGLVEMTRQRVRESLGRLLTEPCFYCDGRGTIKSKLTVGYEVFRQVRRLAPSIREKVIVVHCHPEVADLIYDTERDHLEELETLTGKKLVMRARGSFHQEQFELFGTDEKSLQGV